MEYSTMEKILALTLLITALAAFGDEGSLPVTPAAGDASPNAEPAAAPSSGFADDRYYLALFGTFILPGGDRNTRAGWGAGAGFGRAINEFLNLEIRGFWQGMQADGYPNFNPSYKSLPWDHGSMNLEGASLDLQYFFTRDWVSPYAVFGLGVMNSSYLGSLDWQPFANDMRDANVSFVFEAGAGATVELADNFLIRGDVRYRGDTAPSNFSHSDVAVVNDLLVNLGFVIPLGDKPGASPQSP
ncbi:MAG: OmpA family protein [Proteobacteria bacterium]|nr:OmpA family protein [Pseudomonadota bacterium]